MGTKVQSKSYIPEYNPMSNLNEGSSSSWSPYYENKTLNGHLYNGFMLRPVNGYSGYDKEMLKRMMLEHEAIFRKQVCELHRLYRIQKDLMAELKKKELYKLPVQMDTSQSNLFPSRMPFETTEKIWQMPLPTAVNTSYNCAVVSGTDEMKSPLTLLQEITVQSSQLPSKNGVSVKDSELLDSKLIRFPRRMLDLQLPADVYIDYEYPERTDEQNMSKSPFRAMDPLSMICDVERENDVKLTLGTSNGPNCSKDSWKLDSHQQNGHSIHRLADLCEPLKGLSCGGEAGSVTTNFLGARTHSEETQGHQLQMRSNKHFLPRDFFTDKHRDEGACSNFVNADKEKAGQEWKTFNNEAGKSRNSVNSLNPSLCSEKFPMSSEPSQLKLKRAHEIPPLDHTKTQTWLGEKPSHGIKTSRRSSELADSNYSVLTSPQAPAPFSVVPLTDYSSCASPVVSSRRKPPNIISHIPIAVQALPCFNGPEMLYSRSRRSNGSIRNPSIDRNKLQSNGDLQSPPRFVAESSSHPNGDRRSNSSSATQPKNSSDSSAYETSEGHGSQKFSKSPKDVTFNQSLPNGIPESLTARRDVEGKHEELSGEVSWLRTKQARNDAPMDLGFSQGYSQLKSSSNTMAPETKKTLQDFPSSLQVKGSRMQRNETSHSHSTKKFLGFPILDKLQLTDDIKSSGKNELCDMGMVSGKGVGNGSLGVRNHINLNSLEISPEDVAEVPSPLSLPIIAEKIAHEIDLEVPIPSRRENTGINHLAMPKQITSGKTDGRQGTECSHEAIDRLAAENLVAMSLEIFCPSAPALCDSLHWFADVVSSKAVSPEASDDNGLDLFESMTLKLEEVKPDEYRSQPQGHENQKDGDNPGTASLLLTKPRRGQARKRRQRRDFQKDILPGLASLSRHEVTEDLQAFGGLMRTTGRTCQGGLARRSVGLKGSNCQGRGRRRLRSLAVAVAEIHSSPSLTQPAAHSKVGIDGRSIMGWGRTTRRGRRSRVTSGNASLFLL